MTSRDLTVRRHRAASPSVRRGATHVRTNKDRGRPTSPPEFSVPTVAEFEAQFVA